MALERLLALALLCHGVIAGPSGPAVGHALDQNAAPRKLHGRFLHITDIHPDEFYKVHSSTDEESGCHTGVGPAGPYGAETSDCDSPYALVNATFDWIEANLKDQIDFVVWTGDSARHDRDEDFPRTRDQVLGTNTWIADKFQKLFAGPNGHGMSIPVVPTFGNNDILPHNILLPGPNKWLQTYTHIWRHFIPEEQRHSFEFGGWFNVEVIPNRLAIFSLNTLYFFDRNAGVDGCADPAEPGFKQLEWLRVQLEFMRERGVKVILMGHVPPARTESKKLWDETCWQKYTLWMHQFRDVVVGGLYGHMNIDHFLIHDTKEVDIIALAGMDAEEIDVREAMDDELSIQAGTDYLMELRDDWSKLAPPTTGAKGNEATKGGRRERGKKRKDPLGERYLLSFVNPSIVPTYFPTLRVMEYNTSGLEDTPLWQDKQNSKKPKTAPSSMNDNGAETPQKHLDLRSLSTPELSDSLEDVETFKKKKDKKKKKKKPNKDKKPHDPNLVIPAPPSKTAPPGPAYSLQSLTLIGYTQYYANLTHINNLNLTDPEPQSVEYSTFTDSIYKLNDLTVNSFVELAYRMGQKSRPRGSKVGSTETDEENDDAQPSDCRHGDESDDDENDSAGEMEAEGKKGDKKHKKHKKKKGKKGKKKNKTWLHFLNHAFVGTMDEEELKSGKPQMLLPRLFSLPPGRRARRRRMLLLLFLLLILLLVFIPLYAIYKPPSPLIRYLSHRWTDVLFRIWLPSNKRIVALTIDDAPSDHTRSILAALTANGAHATFFVIGGQVAGREEILREIVRNGHELGNHGMHDEPARDLSEEELVRQIKEVQGYIDAAYAAEGKALPKAGNKRYYRPGSGFFSERIRGVTRRLGYRLVLGSIYPHDAQVGYAWVNARHILSMLSPGGIVICHDRRSWTEPMLRKVLPEMKRRGYRGVTVTELLGEVTG
ncbi:hydrolase-like protein [Podospora australis]|uniref:Hydrolase-like protein n=1 Tax=Podospora australis TaxID=1536484 RepID=A0AAN6WTP5_9PEZI|nr:hydrolase-like protein [Podospora australis]